MKKKFLKVLYFSGISVLTVGMCSAYSVNATKFSLPKKTTLSYDKKIMAGMVFTQM